MQSRQLRRFDRILSGNCRIRKRNLFQNGSGNPLKALFHAAKQTPSDTVRKQISVLSIYFYTAILRTVQPQKQFKNCALSCSGAPGHRYLLTGFYLEAQMLQNHLFLFIAEADVFQGNACDRGRLRRLNCRSTIQTSGRSAIRTSGRSAIRTNSRSAIQIRACAGFAKFYHRFFSRILRGCQPRRQLQKFSDTLRSCQRLLDRLDFHANAFDWGKDSRNIGNYRNRRTDGHAEKRSDFRAGRSRQQHDNARHQRIRNQNSRRIQCIVKICTLHRSISLLQRAVIAFAHKPFFSKNMDHPDAMNRFRHKS